MTIKPQFPHYTGSSGGNSMAKSESMGVPHQTKKRIQAVRVNGARKPASSLNSSATKR